MPDGKRIDDDPNGKYFEKDFGHTVTRNRRFLARSLMADFKGFLRGGGREHFMCLADGLSRS